MEWREVGASAEEEGGKGGKEVMKIRRGGGKTAFIVKQQQEVLHQHFNTQQAKEKKLQSSGLPEPGV